MMLNPEGIPLGPNGTEAAPDPSAALRFEDLTIDDDLSLLDRVVRYVRSGIALQRLVHVKMISDTAKSVGTKSTIETLVPLLPPLVADSESVIRQHLATQILPLSLCCMFGDEDNFDPKEIAKNPNRTYNEKGYKIVTNVILNYINTLIIDTDMDVRKASSDALATLTMFIRPDDIPQLILPIPIRLAHDDKVRMNGGPNATGPKGKDKDDTSNDELRVTACNLLADLASVAPEQIPPKMVAKYITPAILNLCRHPHFRVRRSAVQALPRVLNGTAADDVHYNILPCYSKLAEDEAHRVRKSVGECLVDMSRSLMLLPYSSKSNSTTVAKKENVFNEMNQDQLKDAMLELRRKTLVPVCARLLGDQNKLVRHGMWQFLGPFIASFYPLDGPSGGPENGGIVDILDGEDEDDRVGGLGPHFFPHANGMVSRLDPSHVTETTNLNDKSSPSQPALDTMEYFESHLPEFLEKDVNDVESLRKILLYREKYPVPQNDITTVQRTLLPAYVDLATISTGDDNVDAEMRVYCAYSLPAVLLLLGQHGWEKYLKDCFLALITGWDGKKNEKGEPLKVSPVPLPVKRCLASSFHSICHMLGPEALNSSPKDKDGRDLLTVFEAHFIRDVDDTVRLNVIRNLVSFLSLLSPSSRSNFLPVLYEIITGDTMLASKRTNALNPMVLNWRQRDMVAQILPNLLTLYTPTQVRTYLWPIVKILLCDAVNVVRENAEWSLPVIFRAYETKNWKNGEGEVVVEASRFSAESCDEVIKYLKAILLEKPAPPKKSKVNRNSGAFSNRQGYCRVLTAVATVLRLNGKDVRNKKQKMFSSSPFHNYSSDDYRHLHRILKNHLLPFAIVMKDDKVTNVRLALAKCLRVLPIDIREQDDVSSALQILEDEIDTWEGGGGLYLDGGFDVGSPSGANGNKSSGEKSESSSSRQNNGNERTTNRIDDDSKTLASI